VIAARLPESESVKASVSASAPGSNRRTATVFSTRCRPSQPRPSWMPSLRSFIGYAGANPDAARRTLVDGFHVGHAGRRAVPSALRAGSARSRSHEPPPATTG
jgi:hypothetical protein